MLLPIDSIQPTRGRRTIDNTKVASLADSMARVGLLNPIVVRADKSLVAGRHRLAAALSLGWVDVECNVCNGDDLHAELAECDENACRADLTVLERADHFAWREDILRRMGARAAPSPGTNQHTTALGPALPGLEVHATVAPTKTTAALATDLGLSKRSLQEHLQIARDLTPESKAVLAATPHADSTTTLLDLARVREPSVQAAAARALANDPELTAKDARDVLAVARAESVKLAAPAIPSGPQQTAPAATAVASAATVVQAAAELKREARAAFAERRTARIEGARATAATLPSNEGRYEVIAIDPPWQYDRQPVDSGMRGECDYATMSQAELLALSIPASDDCVLWLWTTNAFMGEAYELLRAWGFTPKTILTWDKVNMGLGMWLRNVTEHCVVGVRGRPVVSLTNQTTLIREVRREHSRKPEVFYRLVETICIGRRLEMFARTPRDGWDRHGVEAEKYAHV